MRCPREVPTLPIAMPPSAVEFFPISHAQRSSLGDGLPRSWFRSNVERTSQQPVHEQNSKEFKVETSACTGFRASDVTIYVGKNRAPYVLSVDTLRGSSYFRSLLQPPSSISSIVLDCEESVFQNMIAVLRYGSLDALPKMSDFEIFKLKRELEFYGIQFSESISNGSSSSRSSTPSSSPKSFRSYRFEAPEPENHFFLSELPDFPTALTDPAKLVLVSFLDHADSRGRCPCTPKDSPVSQWALSVHYMHAFCIGCGTMAAEKLAPKLAAEMFMVAASYFAGGDINYRRWSVACDSTCTLKFLSSDRASCSSCSSSPKNKKETSVWAVSNYYSHAFCTGCRRCAADSTLISILLTSRFGRVQRLSRCKSNME